MWKNNQPLSCIYNTGNAIRKFQNWITYILKGPGGKYKVKTVEVSLNNCRIMFKLK